MCQDLALCGIDGLFAAGFNVGAEASGHAQQYLYLINTVFCGRVKFCCELCFGLPLFLTMCVVA